jgi:NRAMP (natural resistance-associated macrophage protein)-like metal ion transporter
MAKKKPFRKPGIIRRVFSALGPGITAGAADDDPSGIATYSITGAQLGTSLLWTALITWPLMACVQFMCARIGMVTGMGLGDALRRKGPRPLLFFGAAALLVANSLNVGADLSGMADATAMLTGINSHICVVLFGVGIAAATICFRYHKIAAILKWLALVLFAYVITAFIVGPNWRSVLRDTFIPSLPSNHEAWQSLVAILGTTISPYLFFWQASQEVEEEKSMGRRMLADRLGATRRELGLRGLDVGIGTFFSNLVMYFIILATALTLHRHVGMLAIPTLIGSAAYAFAETFSWKEGLDEPFRGALPFYAVVIFSTLLGIGLDLLRINPLKALFYTAVVNGLLAPCLLLGILAVACDRKLMQGQPSSWLSRIVVGATTLVMFAAAAGMFLL